MREPIVVRSVEELRRLVDSLEADSADPLLVDLGPLLREHAPRILELRAAEDEDSAKR